MLCLEVYRNGEKLCRAGIGEYGLVSANVMWLSHEPEKLACWEAEGREPCDPVTLELTVSGADHEGADLEHLKWVAQAVTEGDEITIRVVRADNADEPVERKVEADPTPAMMQRFVRQQAKALGWQVRKKAKRRA